MKTDKKKLSKLLDDLYSKVIRKRAMKRVGGCERCKRPKFDIQKDNGDIFPAWRQLHCAHFHERDAKSVRWDSDNSAGLCPGCHRHLDNHSYQKYEFFRKLLGDKFEPLNERARVPGKPDLEELIAYYKGVRSEENV